MSNPNPTPPNRGLANLERTRQQIQKLDSLLQQMLALPAAEQPPAAPAAEAAPPAVPEPASTAPAPKRLHSLTTARPAAAEPEAAADLKRPLPLPALTKPRQPGGEPVRPPATTRTIAEAPAQAAATIPIDFDPALMDLSGPASFDVGHEHVLDEAHRRWGSGTTKAPARRPIVYRSLVEFNLMFDRTLGLLGPLGRPLTTESGKAWLGWLGLVCLFGAAALALGMWLGWTW